MAPIYKIEEANKAFIFHWIVLMLGALKDIDLTQKYDNMLVDTEKLIKFIITK